MHFYSKNIGDYYKKAGRLSMLQHGAYTLLKDACYDRERFPTMDEAIEWTWASSEKEVDAVKFVLTKFFTLEGEFYTQNRIKEEIEKYKIKGIDNRLIALSREAKKKNRKDHSKAYDQFRESFNNDPYRKKHEAWTVLVDALVKEHEHSPNQEPITNNQEPITKNHSKELPNRENRDVNSVVDMGTGEILDVEGF